MTFKNFLTILMGACSFGAVATHSAAQTVVSVTQINYDEYNRPVCKAIRMNPAAYGTLPSDACALGVTGSNGPDRISKNTYDVAGQLLQVDQALGTNVQRAYARYTYTVNGLKETETDANGNRTTLEYDNFGRLKKLRYPSTALGVGTSSTTDYEEFGYDANGNRTSWRRRNGVNITYCYDNLNRVTRENVSGVSCSTTGQAKDVFTTYDLIGNILSKRFASTSGTGVSYGYDSVGRVSSSTDMYDRKVSYLYNTAGARTRLTYDDGNWQPYNRDNLNRLTFSGMGGSSFTLGYDSLGRMTSVARNNATSTSYGYDNLGRLTSMGHDLAGAANDITWSFNGRNPAGQITSWQATSTVYDYEEVASSTVNAGFDGLNRDSTIAIVSGGYDANGNLANETTQADLDAANKRCMTYDNLNRLLTVARCSTPSIPHTTLTYDPEGRLAAYTVNLVTTEFLYDGVNLIGEYTHSSSDHKTDGMTRRYVHGTGTDQPLLWFLNSGVGSGGNFYVTNYQGSVIGNSSATGVLTELYKYGPYGEPKNAQGAEFWEGARFRYTGQYIINKETRLYYYKARVYDPNYGRFLQTDPIGSDDDLNMYAYVGGDPVNGIDPTGTQVYVGPLTKNSEEDIRQGKTVFGMIAVAAEVGCSFFPVCALAALPQQDVPLPPGGKPIGALTREEQVLVNAANGARRETEAASTIAAQNPGAKIQNQTYLRDANGKIAKDPLTGQARRVDSAALKDGKAQTYEVTGPGVDKAAQAAKEDRILQNGGTYVRDRETKQLCPVNGSCQRVDVP